MKVCNRHEQAYENECPYCEPVARKVYRQGYPVTDVIEGMELYNRNTHTIFRVISGVRETHFHDGPAPGVSLERVADKTRAVVKVQEIRNVCAYAEEFEAPEES